VTVPDAVELDGVEPRGRRRRSLQTPHRWLQHHGTAAFIAAATVILVAASVYSVVLFFGGRTAGEIEEARDAAATSADTAVVDMLSYRFDSVADQLGAAEGSLTPTFRAEFHALTLSTIIPAAVEKQISTSVTVAGTSTVSATTDSVDLLMFLNQNTTSLDQPEPATTGSRVIVTMTSVDGRWLLDGLRPL
jgi:Mce-associated membrane protein